MRRFPALLFLSTLSTISFCQNPADSLIDRLQEKNIVVLNQQLSHLFSHEFRTRIEPDRSKWPALLTSLARKTAERANSFNITAESIVYANIAEVLGRENQIGLGYTYIKRALSQMSKLESLTQADIYYKYSGIFENVSRLDSALFYAEKALDISTQIKNDSIEKLALARIGMMCYRSKNYPKSESYLKRLVNNRLSRDDEKKGYLNTIALTFRNRKEYDSSRYYFRKSMVYAEKAKDLTWIGLINGNIAYTFYLENKYEQALPGLLIDLDYSFKKDNRMSALNALTTVTNIYLIRSQMDLAKLYYDSLARNMRGHRNYDVRLEFYKTSADYFQKIGNPNRSIDFLHSYINLDDSLRIVQNSEKVAQLEAQFNFDRQVKQIELLENQNNTHVEENRQKNYLLVGTSLLILLSAGLIYVLYRNNRFKHDTNELLKNQNDQIIQQSKHLQQLNGTKDKLLSIIGHDLRGPINSLKALLSMASNQMITADEFKHFSSQLQNNLEHVQFTLNNLLHWARSQMQGLELRQQQTNLHAIAEENINLMREPAKTKNISLENKLSKDVVVWADPDQVRLIFRNLTSNAIKFTGQNGQVIVSSHSKDQAEIISISDTGTGMSTKDKGRLFRKEFSSSALGTAGEKGTGLGLLLCQEMVEKNGGTIWVESTPGKGTTFMFSLPYHS